MKLCHMFRNPLNFWNWWWKYEKMTAVTTKYVLLSMILPLAQTALIQNFKITRTVNLSHLNRRKKVKLIHTVESYGSFQKFPADFSAWFLGVFLTKKIPFLKYSFKVLEKFIYIFATQKMLKLQIWKLFTHQSTLEFAPLPGQIDDVKIGAVWNHTSQINMLINMVGRTIFVGTLTTMPYGATLRIHINDGKTVIAIKKMVNTIKKWCHLEILNTEFLTKFRRNNLQSLCRLSVSILSAVRILSGIFEKTLFVVCLSGQTRTRQSCPDFRCPCPPTSKFEYKTSNFRCFWLKISLWNQARNWYFS